MWRYLTEPGYRQWIVWISGVVQTALYAGARAGRWASCCCWRHAYNERWRRRSRLFLILLLPLHLFPSSHADFFYYYALCFKANRKLQLPA